MSKPVLYLFNGKVAKVGNSVLGTIPTPPPSFDSVQIGDQIWMSKNLAIEDGGEGISTSTRNYGQGDVVEHYYTWDAAVRVADSIQGWHLPSQEEYETLISYVGGTSNGKKLMSTYGWQYGSGSGTDDYGFAAFPANTANSTTRNEASFWTTTSDTSETNYFYVCKLSPYSGGTVVVDRSLYKTNRITVRLIKDS